MQENALLNPIIVEACAKIFWGDSDKNVSSFLSKNGISQDDINLIIASAREDRKVEIRENGKGLLTRGIGFFLLGLLAVLISFLALQIGFYLGEAVLAAITFIIYGIFIGLIGFKRYTSGTALGDLSKMNGLFG